MQNFAFLIFALSKKIEGAEVYFRSNLESLKDLKDLIVKTVKHKKQDYRSKKQNGKHESSEMAPCFQTIVE